MGDTTAARTYGLIGYPVKHSLSPAMHNAAFKHLGINATYRLFEIKPELLKDFLLEDIFVRDTEGDPFSSQNIAGFNITIPHKVQALEIARLVEGTLTLASHDVLMAGAINTVKREKGAWQYQNYDVEGFVKSLHEDLKCNTENKIAFVFGCGGAGRAVIAGLSREGMRARRIYIYEPNTEARVSAQKHFPKPSSSKEDIFEFISEEQIAAIIRSSDLLVNATPVGMKEGDGSIVDKDLLHDGLSVYDVVYNRETRLIQDAKAKGLNAQGGLGMLLYQGAAAFRFWTGKEAPVEVMREALMKELGKC